MFDQPGGGQVEEQAGPLGAEPGAGVEPADQAEVLRLVGEVAVAVPPPDLARVLAVRGRAVQVSREAGRVRDPQLATQMGHHAGRDIGRVGEEGAQEPDRDQLQREAQPVLVPTALGDQGEVGVIEMEVPSQLRGRGLAGVAAVAPLLLRGQEIDGHPGFPPGCRDREGALRRGTEGHPVIRNIITGMSRPAPRRLRGIPSRCTGPRFTVIRGSRTGRRRSPADHDTRGGIRGHLTVCSIILMQRRWPVDEDSGRGPYASHRPDAGASDRSC